MKHLILYIGIIFFILTRIASGESISYQRENSLNTDKTVSDDMIERFYSHPEDISDVDAECKEVMEWVDSTVNYGKEKYYHEAILCLTWEINKKLDKEQIELLTKVKSTFHNIIFDLMNHRNIGVLQIMYIDYECELMLVKKIYNMIYSSSIPLCFENPVFSTPDRPSSICSPQPSSYLSSCLKKKDAKICMDKMITEKFLAVAQQEPQAKADIYHLNHFTDKFISSLYTNKTRQNIETLNFYDFYIRLIEDAVHEVKYITEHDV